MPPNQEPKSRRGDRARPQPEKTLDFPTAAAFACAVFALSYWLFCWCQPWIIAVPTRLSPADFMSWVRDSASEQDGREVPVALIGMLLCLGACFEITRRGLGRRVLSLGPVRWASYAAAAAVVWGIRSGEFSADEHSDWVLVSLAAVILAVTWLIPDSASWRWPRVAAAALFATLVVVVLVFTTGEPSISDFGYFIGPTLEWIQGERLGSFYMQYSLLGTLVTAAFVRLGLHVNGMQLVLTFLAIGWLALYAWLARELIGDRALRWLFLICLFVFRVLWLHHHIASLPQVSPIRMELWVPLLLVARKRGLLSPWTAGSFAAAYALDALFGFLYLVVYLVFVAFGLKAAARRGEVRIATVLAILAPVVVAGIINLTLFGSLVAGSATHYLDVKLGFLPISPASLFWAVLLILLVAVVVFARAGTERPLGMFLVSIATVQMVYFLGRSHDHNLINIGGTWLLVAFVALDAALLSSPRFAKTAASVLLIGAFGLGSQRIVAAVDHGFERLLHGPWFQENELDRFLDGTRSEWPTNAANVILFGSVDAYMNYRLGLRQHGYYSPIFAHLLTEETAAWMYGAIEQGNRVIVPKEGAGTLDWLRETVGEWNHTRFMTGHSPGFAVRTSGSTFHFEIVISN